LKILNAIPGFGAPLSEQEIKDFLGTKVLNVHLGTVDEKDDANIHPAWYYYEVLLNNVSNSFYYPLAVLQEIILMPTPASIESVSY
jgi:hypothetical protein